jgi:CheY-like chemotaxis protein
MTDILLIDDNSDSREVFQAVLGSEGMSVVTIGSGADALEWLNTNEVRIIMLDLAMPVLDGLTMADEIRKNERILSRSPAIIAFYTGQPVDDVVENVAGRNDVKRVFEKGRDSWDELVGQTKSWLANDKVEE